MSRNTQAESGSSKSTKAHEVRNDLDVQWVQRTGAGDEEAFESLYNEYYSRLSRFVIHTAGHSALVEEVINDVMLVVWQKATSFNGTCRVSTWIFGIAYNMLLKAMAKARSAPNQFSIDATEWGELPAKPEKQVAQWEIDNWLKVALTVLSPKQRAVVELTYYQEMPYAEIAKVVGCSPNTVKTRMFHARKKLAGALSELRSNR